MTAIEDCKAANLPPAKRVLLVRMESAIQSSCLKSSVWTSPRQRIDKPEAQQVVGATWKASPNVAHGVAACSVASASGELRCVRNK